MVTGLPIYWALGAMLAVGVAELLHAKRSQRLAHLAFGPGGPRRWTRAAPYVRTLAVGMCVWSLIVLFELAPRVSDNARVEDAGRYHLVLGLDVSPSMLIEDAGQGLKQSRADRAREILKSAMERVDLRRTRVSVIAFYTKARPVVVDTDDPEVVRNILDDLPLEHAFAHGKTDLYAVIDQSFAIAKDWEPGSCALLIVTDGDTLPKKGMPDMPPSISSALVVGVGNTRQGKFIDGHVSRQDASVLKRLAAKVRGTYHDGNQKHVATAFLNEITDTLPSRDDAGIGPRGVALTLLGIGASLLAFLGPILQLLGVAKQGRHRGPWSGAAAARRTKVSHAKDSARRAS